MAEWVQRNPPFLVVDVVGVATYFIVSNTLSITPSTLSIASSTLAIASSTLLIAFRLVHSSTLDRWAW